MTKYTENMLVLDQYSRLQLLIGFQNYPEQEVIIQFLMRFYIILFILLRH